MVAAIRIYPVKSLAGVAVDAAEVEPWGLRHDRRWIVLERDGTVVTAREEHGLLGITARPLEGDGIELAARDGATLRVDPPADGQSIPTTLSRLESVRSAGTAADEWLSAQLRRPVQLGWLDDPRRRTVSESHGGLPGDHLNLADAGPLLLTTVSSLRQLNRWIGEGSEVEMVRFRPSVVVDTGDEPFAEDGWAAVRIGEVSFRFGEHCDRCVLTTIDPHALTGGKEPLRTLARHRQWDHKTWFGIRLVPTTTGVIRVGDLVSVD